MVRHGMVFHSVNSETKPCRTMPWARFRLDSPLGTFNMNDDVKVLKGAPANTREKNDDRPLPNLLLRGHVVDTEWDELKVEKPAISQQVLDKTFKDKVIGHSRGLITEAQRAWNERQKFTEGEIPLNRPYFYFWSKGFKENPGIRPTQSRPLVGDRLQKWLDFVLCPRRAWTLWPLCIQKDGPNGTMEPHRGEWL